jgi:hypothetical protein
VDACPKVAAVLGCHEHCYHRTLIDPRVPIGDLAKDDPGGTGRLGGGHGAVSPLAGLRRATWYITSGGGGAPYYAEQPTPWNEYWKRQADPKRGYYFSSQENVCLFHADAAKISLEVLNPYGEVIDAIPDLMATRRGE